MITKDQLLPLVRRTSIVCVEHPEWGTFGIMDVHDGWMDIHGKRGGRVLDFSEFERFWTVVAPANKSK